MTHFDKTNRLFTLVFVKRENRVLLGRKTRGLGCGLWNGFGGKLETNETIHECAIRELYEESNLIGNNLNLIGIVRYDIDDCMECHIVYVFVCYDFYGDEHESDEMNPLKWYNFDGIPFNEMWPDSSDWYPLMLNDLYFSAHIFYGNHGKIREKIIKTHTTLKQALELVNV